MKELLKVIEKEEDKLKDIITEIRKEALKLADEKKSYSMKFNFNRLEKLEVEKLEQEKFLEGLILARDIFEMENK